MLQEISTESLFTIGIVFTFDAIVKGFALYRAGTRRDTNRFIFLFILNTCGILPIIYLITHEDIEKH